MHDVRGFAALPPQILADHLASDGWPFDHTLMLYPSQKLRAGKAWLESDRKRERQFTETVVMIIAPVAVECGLNVYQVPDNTLDAYGEPINNYGRRAWSFLGKPCNGKGQGVFISNYIAFLRHRTVNSPFINDKAQFGLLHPYQREDLHVGGFHPKMSSNSVHL